MMAYEELQPHLLGTYDELAATGYVGGDGFLDEHVDAGGKELFGNGDVEMVWYANDSCGGFGGRRR